MTAAHAYTTLVRDEESGLGVDISTLAREAISEDLVARIEARDADGLVHALVDSGATSGEVGVLGTFEPGQLKPADLRLLIGAVLSGGTLNDVVSSWSHGRKPSDAVSNFIEVVLGSTILVEYSDPHAVPVEVAMLGTAGVVGAATAKATGTVIVAAVAAHVGGGVALVIAGPVGIAVVGVGATVAVYRLLKGRRRRAT